MHGRFEKRDGYKKGTDLRRDVGLGFLILPVVIAIALLTLAVVQPTANWIAEAVQAEFVGGILAPGQSPTQLAQPAGEPHSAAADWMFKRVDAAYRGQR